MFIAVVPDYWEENSVPKYGLRTNYMQALLNAGALPIVVPYNAEHIDTYLQQCHGLMIIGGGHSIDPELFGQPYSNPLPLKKHRTQSELRFFHKAFARRMPILGICGGMQLINVALGGSLIQHLPTSHPQALPHSHPFPTEPAHDIMVTPHTFLASILPGVTHFASNSNHVQAVDSLGKDVRINALAPDGVIEGIEVTSYPFCLGLQWHPEYYAHTLYDPLIFSAFVQHTQAYASLTKTSIIPVLEKRYSHGGQ